MIWTQDIADDSLPVCGLRHGGERQDHLHPSDEDHSRQGLHGRREEGLRSMHLPEHLHRHSGLDQRHGDTEDPLLQLRERGQTHASAHTHTHAHEYAHKHAHTETHTSMHTHSHTHVCAHTSTQTHRQACTHTHTHA